jgi:hypothetical protein
MVVVFSAVAEHGKLWVGGKRLDDDINAVYNACVNDNNSGFVGSNVERDGYRIGDGYDECNDENGSGSSGASRGSTGRRSCNAR